MSVTTHWNDNTGLICTWSCVRHPGVNVPFLFIATLRVTSMCLYVSPGVIRVNSYSLNKLGRLTLANFGDSKCKSTLGCPVLKTPATWLSLLAAQNAT